ncbi:hypothetical protein AB5J62_24080 [Amycolatopsis sp. cg5]|uniref:hypothetical protein n=1 Tax=Amycolatopsis sp. cg5 TaxID=3238802 RepID=UPI003525B0D9
MWTSHACQSTALPPYDVGTGAYTDDLVYWETALDRYEPGRVLELVSGTGRISIPLITSGKKLRSDFRYTGLDIVGPATAVLICTSLGTETAMDAMGFSVALIGASLYLVNPAIKADHEPHGHGTETRPPIGEWP